MIDSPKLLASLQGKLDVPMERWITYSGTERIEDPSRVITLGRLGLCPPGLPYAP